MRPARVGGPAAKSASVERRSEASRRGTRVVDGSVEETRVAEAGAGEARASDVRDADVEGFLALFAASRSPRTVEAYRRDLSALRAYLVAPVSTATT